MAGTMLCRATLDGVRHVTLVQTSLGLLASASILNSYSPLTIVAEGEALNKPDP
jgi:hypothetical protein